MLGVLLPGCIAVMMRPIPERFCRRKSCQVPAAISVRGKRLEDLPQVLDMVSVVPSYWYSCGIEDHPHGRHSCLETAFRAESVELVGVRPSIVAEQKLRILPVPAVGIDKVWGARHRPVCLPDAFRGEIGAT